MGVDCCTELDLVRPFVYGNCKVNLQAKVSSQINMQTVNESCTWPASFSVNTGHGSVVFLVVLVMVVLSAHILPHVEIRTRLQ